MKNVKHKTREIMKAVDPTVCDSVSDCAVKREPEKIYIKQIF